MASSPKPRKSPFALRRFDDGPLRARPPEEIRYAFGKCSLGHVLVATSDEGIVTIMIRKKAALLVPQVRVRFPKASLLHDEKGLRPVVAKVVRYIAAPVVPFDLPLDIRGTEFQQCVWREVRKIPFGQTSTYSKIAEAIGAPKAVRAVGSSCTHNWLAFAVPCHRVLHKHGANPAAERRPDSIQYRWVDYEAGLIAGKRKA